jgi:hypothetical protein
VRKTKVVRASGERGQKMRFLDVDGTYERVSMVKAVRREIDPLLYATEHQW